jgi:hypothetical protein
VRITSNRRMVSLVMSPVLRHAGVERGHSRSGGGPGWTLGACGRPNPGGAWEVQEDVTTPPSAAAAVPRRRRARRTLALALGVGAIGSLAGCAPPTPEDAAPTVSTSASPTGASPDAASQSAVTPAGTPDPSLVGAYATEPVPVPPDVEHEAARQCRLTPAPGFVDEIGSRQVAVTDLRGMSLVLVVFADGAGATGCAVDVRRDGSMRAGFFRVAGDPAEDLDTGGVSLWALQYPEAGGADRTIAVGRAGDAVATVRIEFDADPPVTASLRDGWYAAWWRGGRRPSAIRAVDDAGTTTGRVSAR